MSLSFSSYFICSSSYIADVIFPIHFIIYFISFSLLPILVLMMKCIVLYFDSPILLNKLNSFFFRVLCFASEVRRVRIGKPPSLLSFAQCVFRARENQKQALSLCPSIALSSHDCVMWMRASTGVCRKKVKRLNESKRVCYDSTVKIWFARIERLWIGCGK